MQENISVVLIWTILGSLATIIFFIFFINYIIILYNKKNIEFNTLIQLRNLEKEKELLKTRVEVQEETIQKISKELHDNVNQILTLAKLNLNNISSQVIDNKKLILSRDLITNAINELSNLSNSLSSQMVKDIGLLRTIEIESARIMTINKTRIVMENSLQISNISEDDQLTLYRIFQEATRNAILHGNAKNIFITLYKSGDYDFIFEIRDDGNGFDTKKNHSVDESKKTHSQGLNNMRRRTSMINGEFQLESIINKGTKIIIKKQNSINNFVSHPIHN